MSIRLLRSPRITAPVRQSRLARRPVVDSPVDAVTSAALETLAASPVLAAYETRAWVDLVLRSLARETNSLLASTRFLVLGDGPVAETLTGALVGFGGRVELASDRPVEVFTSASRYAAHGRVIDLTQFVPAAVDVVVATGHHHPVLTPDALEEADRPLIVVNAALPPADPDGAYAGAEVIGRARTMAHLSGPRPVFAVPPVTGDELDGVTAWARAAYAALYAVAGRDGADAQLAKALLR